MVSAAAFINNGCRFECSMAGLEDMAVQTVGWAMVCELLGSVHMATITFSSSHNLTNSKRLNVAPLICHRK